MYTLYLNLTLACANASKGFFTRKISNLGFKVPMMKINYRTIYNLF